MEFLKLLISWWKPLKRCLGLEHHVDNDNEPSPTGNDDSKENSQPEPDTENEQGNKPIIVKPPPPIDGRRKKGHNESDNSLTDSDEDDTGKKELIPEKYNLICRKKQGEWCVFIKFPSGNISNIRQNGEKLQNRNDEYELLNFSDPVTWKEENEDKKFDCDKPLIFRYSTKGRGTGKLVRLVAKTRHSIIIAPQKWTRISRHPPAEPESCSDNGFLAHHFPADGKDGFEDCDLSFSDRFSLDGEIVDDNSEKGSLFVGDTPNLKDNENWQDISWIRIGEEGKNGESENFKPPEKEILADFLKDRAGWFYVRIYDQDVKLLDSFDFRFSPKLKNILINDTVYSPGTPIIPDNDGHKTAQIRFVDDKGANMDIKLSKNNDNVSKNDDGIFEIAPHRTCDLTQWTLKENSGDVDIDIALPRVWWRMGEKWGDKPLPMTRQEFYENRGNDIEIMLPIAIKHIEVSFDDMMDKKIFMANRNTDGIHYAIFSMRNFADHEKIEKPSTVISELCIQCGAKRFPVIRILAESPPPLPEPPIAYVCSSKGRRRGKGFSMSELRKIGLSAKQARCIGIKTDSRRRTKGIKTDTRRRTKHDYNIASLIEYAQGGY